MYNSINFDLGVDDTVANDTIAKIRVAGFLCHSDAAIWQRIGLSSYAGNMGDGCYPRKYNGLFTSDPNPPPNVAPKEISDGLSGTAAISEWLIGVQDVPDRRRLFFRPNVVIEPLDLNQFAAPCIAASANNSNVAITNLKGVDWFRGQWSRTLYDHAIPINGPNCVNPVFTEFLGACTAGSLHPGGANVLMSDGHARFVIESTDMKVWRALGTRNEGEVVSSDAFSPLVDWGGGAHGDLARREQQIITAGRAPLHKELGIAPM